ncbi:MAG: hypothetical protein EBZ77_03885 [Chitinophagia bacterium]|nr:hypothetical protein [Chitinophagia bacterium]
MDIHSHENEPTIAMVKLRNWLRTASRRRTIPGDAPLLDSYQNFLGRLPEVAHLAGLQADNLIFNDYCYLVEEILPQLL